jgi:hypothetical protein
MVVGAHVRFVQVGRPSYMTGLRPLTMLKALIVEAESRFGARTFPLAWVSVGLIDEGSPRATMIDDGRVNLVLVGQDLLDDGETLTYQLAHEALHCLGSCRHTTALEEGLATLFGLDNSLLPKARSAIERGRLDPERRGYLEDVEALLATDAAIVRRLREPPVAFEAIRAADLAARGVPDALAARLCRPAGAS